MLLFKNDAADKETDKTMDKPASRYVIIKQRLADYLRKKSETVSLRIKKYVLILFCCLSCGGSAIIATRSFTNPGVPHVSLIERPMFGPQVNPSVHPSDSIITKRQYDRVMRFKENMISLKNDPVGKAEFDSIMRMRPQLLDSISLFEKTYLSQKKQ